MKVILPGSYDPITLGHLLVVNEAARRYDEVYVVAFINPAKKYMFSDEERVEMIRLATEHIPNVKVDFSEGFVIDYMKAHAIDKIFKGYRNDADLEYEKKQAEYNLKNGGFETELWLTDPSLGYVSSTLAREAIKNGEDLTKLLPEKVISFINNH